MVHGIRHDLFETAYTILQSLDKTSHFLRQGVPPGVLRRAVLSQIMTVVAIVMSVELLVLVHVKISNWELWKFYYTFLCGNSVASQGVCIKVEDTRDNRRQIHHVDDKFLRHSYANVVDVIQCCGRNTASWRQDK
ncbi:uncharacterized protein MYCGRDRAFT_97599 [Zymoseptoria tritici IPO323]|uniref:Uncharacterized protein n=1 Tax=Zymoseptoria tritici (strain CBS 115943 / IPO323) TaxID=336722 RepID=F9XQS6_ZYMTI|nr:uncharacterized protein MYCGRDRAFT_97599 [Zymoseptoria tritici IPO323]EGP82434.1 hypothetical protein MYCGRDRAFT_97599 [Zymoseptoria tritici IPO323]